MSNNRPCTSIVSIFSDAGKETNFSNIGIGINFFFFSDTGSDVNFDAIDKL